MTQITTPDASIILVIDDDARTRSALQGALHCAGHETHVVSDCEEALKVARGNNLELVLCDIDLGEHDGIELWREIKQLPHLANTAVIFMSHDDKAELTKRTHAAGGPHFLRKPFKAETLLKSVEDALWMPHLMHAHLLRRRRRGRRLV